MNEAGQRDPRSAETLCNKGMRSPQRTKKIVAEVSLIALLFHALWVCAAIRILCWRSTISNRTMLTYLALGAFISFSVAGPVFRAANPYSDASAWLSFSWNVAQLLLELPF